MASSCVRLQWDPDHGPSGNPLDRRAIQLGLRGETLAKYARDWCLEIQDVSEFVREQREQVMSRQYERLITPKENVYSVTDARVAEKLGLDRWAEDTE